MRITVCRKAHFNAAHRLHNPDLTPQENAAVFGKCNNEFFHGHNYELIVHVEGEVVSISTTNFQRQLKWFMSKYGGDPTNTTSRKIP